MCVFYFLVTTSKALVTSSVALVTTSKARLRIEVGGLRSLDHNLSVIILYTSP